MGMTAIGSIVSTLGGGSGIDMSKLASDLASAQFAQRQDRLESRTALLEKRISAAGTIRNTLRTLANSLGDRVRTGDLSPKPQISEPAVASVAIAPGASAAASYTLEVIALARGQVLASAPFPGGAGAVGGGMLIIRFGTVTDGGFTSDAARNPVLVTIAPNATLHDAARAINASAAGITAYVAQAAEGARLVCKGPEGASNGFVIEAAESDPGNGLAALGWQPTTGARDRLTGQAGDASFRVDGLLLTSTQNTVRSVAGALDLTLRGINAGTPATIRSVEPGAAIAAMMGDLTAALNELATSLRAATAPNGGELAGDAGARALRLALSRLTTETVMPTASGQDPRTLSDLGLRIERDGSFAFDAARLAATAGRSPAGTAAMMTAGLHGVFATVDRLARSVGRAGDPGSLAGSIARYEKLSAVTNTETGKLAEKQEALRQQFTRRFAGTDARVAASQSTLGLLKAQIDAWNAGKG